MADKKSKTENRKLFLARDVAQLVVSRYPSMPLEDVKFALMSAEEFIMQTMHYRKKDGPGGT